ncbi:MAG: type II toxin-antitoxin system RelE/ParE family toxin [Bacteroidia bacterium]
MAIKVVWTQFAEDKLFDIFEYYKEVAGLKVATTLVNGITDQTISLQKNAFLGAKEDLLKSRKEAFRYLIFKNYKIIYWYNSKSEIIYIAHVFDCRQNPTQIAEF